MKLEYTEQIKLLNAIICYNGGIGQIEKILGISKQAIQLWKEKGFVPREYANKLSKLFDRISPDELIDLNSEQEYIKSLDELAAQIYLIREEDLNRD